MNRPRLGEHVLARAHQVGGRRLVVLRSERGGGAGCIGPREWAVVRSLDGTRDRDGVVAAMQARGRRARAEELAAFLAELERAGLLEEGSRAPAPADRFAPPAAAPIEALPEFSLACDGRGSCCRIHSTILFSPLESLRARALAPEVCDGGADEERVFTPERGSRFLPWLARAVVQIGGRCAYLSPERRCVLHERGDAAGKPLGCRLFPASFVFDGEAVRVAPRPECRCVIASARKPPAAGAPLVSVARAGDLDAAVHVESLAESVVVAPGRTLDRAAIRALGNALASARGDAVGHLEARAAALEPDRPLSATLEEMAARIERRIGEESWRSADDLALAVLGWMRQALARMTSDGGLGQAEPIGEAFYLRATSHAFGWALEGEPIAEALRRRAARLCIARRLREVVADTHALARDPALDEPIALVEAVARGYGL